MIEAQNMCLINSEGLRDFSDLKVEFPFSFLRFINIWEYTVDLERIKGEENDQILNRWGRRGRGEPRNHIAQSFSSQKCVWDD